MWIVHVGRAEAEKKWVVATLKMIYFKYRKDITYDGYKTWVDRYRAGKIVFSSTGTITNPPLTAKENPMTSIMGFFVVASVACGGLIPCF